VTDERTTLISGPRIKEQKRSFPDLDERQSVLGERHRLKMAGFAHAYVRGNTLKSPTSRLSQCELSGIAKKILTPHRGYEPLN
jgi:hypothetical protein